MMLSHASYDDFIHIKGAQCHARRQAVIKQKQEQCYKQAYLHDPLLAAS